MSEHEGPEQHPSPSHTSDGESQPSSSLGDMEKDTSTSPTTPHADFPPDGGLAAWSVVLGAWCTSFCSFGWLVEQGGVGIFQDYYERELLQQYSSSTVAWIPSLQVFFMSAMGPVVGHIYDRYGPREVILVGTFMHVFGLMMASISKEYYQILLSQGVCSAIGAAAIFQPALSSVVGWFDKRRAAAFGVLMTGSSTGGVLFPIMITHLISKVGYGWSMRIAAFIILFLLCIANFTVRCRTKPNPPKLAAEDFHRPFHELKFLLVIIGFAIFTFGMYVPVNFLVLTAIDKGMSATLAQYLVSMFNAASLFGRLFSGLMGDKLGRYNMFVTVCTISAILILGLWLPGSSNATSIIFAILFGFFSGAYISLSPALVAQISPPKEFGYRSGLLFCAGSIPGLVTSPIAGAILSHDHGSYAGMKIYSGVFCLAGTVVVAVARFVGTGPKILAKF